jgi:hypothetical protein
MYVNTCHVFQEVTDVATEVETGTHRVKRILLNTKHNGDMNETINSVTSMSMLHHTQTCVHVFQ